TVIVAGDFGGVEAVALEDRERAVELRAAERDVVLPSRGRRERVPGVVAAAVFGATGHAVGGRVVGPSGDGRVERDGRGRTAIVVGGGGRRRDDAQVVRARRAAPAGDADVVRRTRLKRLFDARLRVAAVVVAVEQERGSGRTVGFKEGQRRIELGSARFDR